MFLGGNVDFGVETAFIRQSNTHGVGKNVPKMTRFDMILTDFDEI
jgi:hypothetical protein